MKKHSLSARAKEQDAKSDRSFRLGSIAMLPAGLALLVSAIVQLHTGDYTIGQNFYGAPTGPGLRATMGLVLSCLGALFLWLSIRNRRTTHRGPDNKP
jgi:hypothetical protein